MRFLVCLYIIYALTLPVGAREYTYRLDPADAPENAWEELRDSLPDDVRQELEDVSLADPAESAEAVREKADLRFWLGKALDVLSDSAGDLMPLLNALLSLVVIGAAAELALPAFSPAVGTAFLNFLKLTAALTVFRSTFEVLESARTHLGLLCSFMNLMTPVMQAVYLAEGSVTQSALSSSSLMLAMTVLADLNSILLFPVIRGLYTLAAVSMACPEIRIDGLVTEARKLTLRIWTVITLFFSFFLGIQTVLARSADDLAAKTAKFALGTFVPVAGGMLAEAFSTLRAGMRTLRLSAGIGGILALTLILLPGIVPLAAYRLTLSLAGTAAGLLGQNGMAALLGEAKGVTELLTAAVLCTGTLFLFAVILFTGVRFSGG